MKEAAKNAYRGLHLLAELSKQTVTIGQLEDVQSHRYLQKGEYRDAGQSGIDWVN
jgi:hypothetical protein